MAPPSPNTAHIPRRTECVKNFIQCSGGLIVKAGNYGKFIISNGAKGQPHKDPTYELSTGLKWFLFFISTYFGAHEHTQKMPLSSPFFNEWYTHVQKGSTTHIRVLSSSPFYRRKHFINFDSLLMHQIYSNDVLLPIIYIYEQNHIANMRT